MQVQNLLQLVQDALQHPDVSATDVCRDTGIGYDSILRIKRGSHHDPSWSSVYTLATHLFSPDFKVARKSIDYVRPEKFPSLDDVGVLAKRSPARKIVARGKQGKTKARARA